MFTAFLAIAFVHLWTHIERGWMLGIPTIANGIVYEGTTLGDVLALGEDDGRVVWRAALGANPDETYGNPRGVVSSIAVANRVVYAISGSCEAAAFAALSGSVIWKRQVCSIARNDDTYASPVVMDGRVLFGIDVTADRATDAGRELALDSASGVPAWSFTPVRYRGTGGGISTTPAIDASQGLAIIGTGNPTPMASPPAGPDPYTDSVIAFQPQTGRWRWVSGPLIPHDVNDFDIFASPQLFELQRRGHMIRAVGVVLKDARYVMLDERNGRILWQRQLEPAMSWIQAIGTPATAGKTIVVPLYHDATRGELIALRADDGAIIWRAPTGGIYEAPVIWRRVVLAAQAGGSIAAFDLGDGAHVGELALASKLFGHGLALDGDRLFVAARGGLWVYRLVDR